MTSNQLFINVKDHGVTVDPLKNRVKCNYCDKVVGGFNRLKYHLGGIRGAVTPCLEVPVDVKEMFSNEVSLQKQVNLSKEVGELYCPPLPLRRNRGPQPDSIKCNMTNLTDTEGSWTKQHCNKDCQSDNSVTETVPSPRRLSEMPASSTGDSSLNESKKRIAFVGDIDAMLLFLDRVLNEVGVENVVQIITYSTSAFMKEVGKQLTHKHRHVFWTVSASTCFELMLVKFESMSFIREILEKAKTITRFVQKHPSALKLLRTYTRVDNILEPSKIRSTVPYLTLENIVLEKKGLKNMFASPEWKNSDLSDSFEGKRVAYLVEDPTFWNGALMVLKAAIPIVRVLCLINKNNKPQIDLIYETVDQAKETIKEGFKNNKSQYMPFWKVIDEIWNEHLHNPLHSAGYYLNPFLFYSNDSYSDPEVSCGMCYCVVKMSSDHRNQDLIMDQVDEYSKAMSAFSEGSEPEWLSDVSQLSPVLWWTKYQEKYPQLQQLAIQILSQTCDGALKFKLKRSLAEMLLTKGMNLIEQQKLRDLMFVHYNLQLQIFESSERNCISGNEIDTTDDWIVDVAQDDDVVNNGEPALMV
ncbi:unnamed protein product [Fraxinus pennsylvanica]|uniref:BED-type domain-containing protein n=1 Tax=Fraxinus pennsylvanica TaxID=56036 RepID=A0AAD2DZI3_9LAMI|nr:unnamed protein product [Fraxinus pennsylvanica]